NVGFGYAQAKPQLDDAGLQRGIAMTVRNVAGDGMLRGLLAAQPTARTSDLTVVFDRPMQWEHCMAVAREGERGREDRLGIGRRHGTSPYCSSTRVQSRRRTRQRRFHSRGTRARQTSRTMFSGGSG